MSPLSTSDGSMKVKNQPWKKRLKYENPLSPSLSAADARRLLHLYYSFRSTCTHRQRWLKLTRACDFSLLWVSLNQAVFLFLLNSCTCKIFQIINTITLCSVFYFCRFFFFCICTESTESFYTSRLQSARLFNLFEIRFDWRRWDWRRAEEPFGFSFNGLIILHQTVEAVSTHKCCLH